MNDTFVHYAEPAQIVNDARRQVHAGSGEVGGLELHWLSVGKEDVLLTTEELRHLTDVLLGMDLDRPDRTPGHYLYRVVITAMPEGSTYESGHFDLDWEPAGWDPDVEWVQRHGSRRFFWPTTKFEYKSKSSARARARLIESYGAETRIEQSSRITWPADVADEVV